MVIVKYDTQPHNFKIKRKNCIFHKVENNGITYASL